MDEWYEIGTHIICRTCLGNEISGVLVAYDIEQKLLFLKRTTHTHCQPRATSTSKDQPPAKNSKTQYKSLPNSPLVNGSDAPQPSFQSTSTASLTQGGPSPYVLVNLRWVSSIEEVRDEDSIRTASLMGKAQQLTQQQPAASGKGDGKNTAGTGKNSKSGSGDALQSLSSEEKSLVDSLTPPSQLEVDKLRQRLQDNKDQKFKEADLAKLGVTRDGLDLISVIRKTMGKVENVEWDQANIKIFNDVKISPPYTIECAELVSNGNNQTLQHIRKIVGRFYKDKEDRLAAAVMAAASQDEDIACDS